MIRKATASLLLMLFILCSAISIMRTADIQKCWEDGVSTSYALFNIQDRGELFIEPGVKVYNGMIIGRNSRPGDIDVNVCRKKHMTNSRNSAAAEEALKITGVHIPTLEEAMEFIDDDELVEITPKSIRMRKKVLGTEARKKLEARKKNG